MLKHKKFLVALGIVGAAVLVLGGIGYAYAQGPQPPTSGQFSRGRGSFNAGKLGEVPFAGAQTHGGPFLGRGDHSLVEVTAEVTGLSEDEVIAALQEGQTFAEIAEAEGVDSQEIVDAAVAEAEDRLEEAVADGRMTEEQVALMLGRLAEDLPERLEQSWQVSGPMRGGILGQFNEGFWTMYDAVAETLELTPEELFSELHGGKSVSEVAEAQGVEMEAIHDALEEARAEARKEAIEQAVEEGRLSQEQADWMIEGLEQGYMPGGGNFGSGHGGGPGRGGRGRGMGW